MFGKPQLQGWKWCGLVSVGCWQHPPRFQALRRTMRLQGKAYNTEIAYVKKVRAFMADRGLKKLADFQGIGASDVEAHLTDLAVDGDVAPSTQDQAFYALLFLFQHVLERDFGKINAIRSTKAARIPTVMSKLEVVRVLSLLAGVYLLIGQLLYGCGMRPSPLNLLSPSRGRGEAVNRLFAIESQGY